MPCPFADPKMFCAGPNFLSQPKNLTAFSSSRKTYVLAQKPILLNVNHLFIWHKKSQNVIKYFLSGTNNLDQPKTFLEPVKGQSISLFDTFYKGNLFRGID